LALDILELIMVSSLTGPASEDPG